MPPPADTTLMDYDPGAHNLMCTLFSQEMDAERSVHTRIEQNVPLSQV